MTEEELINRARSDPEYFAVLYDNHYHTVLNYVYRRTGDYSVSLDITSETFLKALMGIKNFNYRRIPVAAWFYRIATNEVNMYFRRKKKYHPHFVNQMIIDYRLDLKPSDHLEKAEEIRAAGQEYLRIRKIISRLPLRYQEVLSLRYFEQMSVAGISLILKKKQGTVKSLLSRGLVKIRKIYDSEQGD